MSTRYSKAREPKNIQPTERIISIEKKKDHFDSFWSTISEFTTVKGRAKVKKFLISFMRIN